MSVKVATSKAANQWPPAFSSILHWRFGVLTALVLVGMVVVWSIDACTIRSFIQSWRYPQDLTFMIARNTYYHIPKRPVVKGHSSWISSELEPSLSSNLIARWSARGGRPCEDSRTVEIAIPSIEDGKRLELLAGDVYEFFLQALDDSGKPRCSGGDYFETDLSGEAWKSRPLVKDFNNGS